MILTRLIAISLLMTSSITYAYNILVLAPFPYRGNWIFIESIIDNLLKKGHSVTTISPYKFRDFLDYKSENLREYIIPEYPIENLCKK